MQLEMTFNQATRKTDPPSSHVAEKKVTDSGKRLSNCQKILDALGRLKKQGLNGATGREIAMASGVDYVTCMKRLSDLAHSGKVVRGVERICRTDGVTPLITWWLC
ncbi:hypothetical protein KAR91_09035 [Candidatus Pacearchaeota archaeon]|nr:hypothetical protein [Candidatus Pacearchaeota archaeon]